MTIMSTPQTIIRKIHKQLTSIIITLILSSSIHHHHGLGAVNAVPTRITWSNGIGHTIDHMHEGNLNLSDIFNCKVEFCHNPTAMTKENDYFGYIGDLTQAGTQKLGRITAEVNELVGSVIFVKQSNP
mmetsp:Transcript_24744/g.36279  ORF Transcript_24744/g.36279 Transcript_24744/m.36279 type:complete len:128 (+) Transcript_24744:83-466(+)